MARIIFHMNRTIQDAQFAEIYEAADGLNVGISLYGNTPSPTRDSFVWLIKGSTLGVHRMKRYLRAMP